MKFFYIKSIFIIITLSILSFTPTDSFCKEAGIKDVIITNTPRDLLLYFDVDGCFTKKMEEAILNGMPTTFTFFINVYRPRRFWFDKAISKIVVRHTIVYNNLKNEFRVFFNSENKKEVILKDFLEAKNVMTEVNGVSVISMSSLERDNTYYIKMKAELDPIKLPFFLNYMLFFVSLWDFETDWYTEFFIY